MPGRSSGNALTSKRRPISNLLADALGLGTTPLQDAVPALATLFKRVVVDPPRVAMASNSAGLGMACEENVGDVLGDILVLEVLDGSGPEPDGHGVGVGALLGSHVYW